MCTIKNYRFIISALGSAYSNDYEKYTKEAFFFYTLLNNKNTQLFVNKQYCTKKNMSWWVKFNDMQQLKNINKTDRHIHTHKKRYLEVISRSKRFKEFNREKKTATKTSNMFKIVPRIGTCDAGFSSSKFHSSCLPFVVKQTTLPVFS